MTALPIPATRPTDPALATSPEGVRVRTVQWTDPARARFQLRGHDGLARLQAIARGEAPAPPTAALLGLQIDEAERGRVVFSMLADEMYENPMGTMHGGVIATLVDTAMGSAVSSMLDAADGFTTLELKTNYVRPITALTGRVRAEGRVVHLGGRVATTTAQVVDDDGTLYAHATSTCLVVRKGGRP